MDDPADGPKEEDREFDALEVAYFRAKVKQYATQLDWNSIEESEDDDGNWQGVFESRCEEDGCVTNETFFVGKPMEAPYVQFEFCLPVDPLFFKQRVREIIAIIADYGLSVKLDETLQDGERLLLQLGIRVFVSNLNVETFEYVAENLLSCKTALVEYVEENGGAVPGTPPPRRHQGRRQGPETGTGEVPEGGG
ncbi:MAG: hypothetical protein HY722_09030 [Planctomycetes bacterium]|nr:hypothetical protein [Planctomycetota bacterium]